MSGAIRGRMRILACLVAVAVVGCGAVRSVADTASQSGQQPSRQDDATFVAQVPDDRLVEFYVWSHYDALEGEAGFGPSGLWRLRGVHPYLVVYVTRPDKRHRNAPGAGPFAKEVPFDAQRDSWEGKAPEAAAHQVAGWVRWWSGRLREVGRSDFRYTLYPFGFGASAREGPGNPRNGWALGENPLDRLTTGGLPDQVAHEVWFTRHGRALNAEWSGRFFHQLEKDLEEASLPRPAYLLPDFEAFLRLRSVRRWLPHALADPRAKTERIDGISTLEDLAAGIPADGARGGWSPEIQAWWLGLWQRCREFALWEGFFQPARAVWPQIPIGSYYLVPGSEEHPFSFRSVGREVTTARLRHVTHAVPPLYPVRTAHVRSQRKAAAQLRRFGVDPTGDLENDQVRAWVAHAKHKIDVSLAHGLQVAPFIATPGTRNSKWPTAATTGPTLEILRYGIDRGVRTWLVWGEGDWQELRRVILEANRHAARRAEEAAPPAPTD